MNITVLGLVGLEGYAAECGLSERLAGLKARGERLADACAHTWLASARTL